MEGLLDGSYLFVDCRLFYNAGETPLIEDLFINPEIIGAISEPVCFKNFGEIHLAFL